MLKEKFSPAAWLKFHPIFISFFLIVIILIKFFYSQHLAIDVSPFTGSDPFCYLLKAREILAGDFEQMKTHSMGWSVFLAPFFYFWKMPENFQYMPLQMALSILFSIFSAPLFYLLAKKYLNNLVALMATAVFALSPLMIENSLQGLTEPAFMFVSFLSFILLLKKTGLSLCLSFLLVGAALWLRANGLFFFLAYFLIALLILKMNKKQVALAVVCFLILFIPYVAQRYNQFGAVFDYGSVSKYLHQDYRTVWVENYPAITIGEFLRDNGFAGTISFLFKGIKKLITHFRVILYPITILLLPLGLWQAVKKRTPEVTALLLFCLITFAPLFFFYPAQGNMRHLFPLLPFLIIIAFLGINDFFENKKFLAALFLIGVIFTNVVNIQFYFFYQKPLSAAHAPDQIQEGQYLAKILKGKLAEDASSTPVFTPNIHYLKPTNNAIYSNGELAFSGIYATNLKDYISEAKKYNFTHIYLREKNAYPFFDDVYLNEKNYDKILTKVYDAQDFNIKTNAKVFKIN